MATCQYQVALVHVHQLNYDRFQRTQRMFGPLIGLLPDETSHVVAQEIQIGKAKREHV